MKCLCGLDMYLSTDGYNDLEYEDTWYCPDRDCECDVGFNDDFEIPEGVLFIEDEQKGRKFLKV